MELVIHIPNLPDRRLGPNRSRNQHWGTFAKLKSELQHDTLGGIMQALQDYKRDTGQDWQIIEDEAHCTIKIVNAKRRMDFDNTVSCLKYTFDVLQGRVIVNDSTLLIHPPVIWIKGKIRETGIWLFIHG